MARRGALLVAEVALGVVGPGVADGAGLGNGAAATTTLSFSILASAHTNFPLSPATAKPLSGPPP